MELLSLLASGAHGPEFTVVFLVCLFLLLGAALRWLSSLIKVPYTIAVMLVGLAIGFALKTALHGGGHGEEHHVEGLAGMLLHLLEQGAGISPGIIIFVFLPALVFESAFSLDVHAFSRNLGAVSLLAVPALLVSTVATAFLLSVLAGVFGMPIPFTACLVFGSLISATDPVAVVAILKETGAPKRLGILIEGESLLNDGTAIVIFNVLLALLVSGGGELDYGAAFGSFLKVVSGGLIVGFLLAWALSSWIARTFNDPLVEITLTLVLAYACMFVGEGLLHVSGVIAIVTAGLFMSGPGRTRISPEVMHFLHEFWEMLTYIANTLIFFLVGLVIAVNVHKAGWADVGLILTVYAGIIVLRFAITFGFLPLMNLAAAEPIDKASAAVMSWGGLRGAVSLALALIIFQNPEVAKLEGGETLQEHLLLITTGVVFLTVAVNGGTTGRLLAKLGMDQPPASDQIAQNKAMLSIYEHTRHEIDELAGKRELRAVLWSAVREDIDKHRDEIRKRIESLRKESAGEPPDTRSIGYWRLALSVERGAWWSAFGEGTLGARAVSVLSHEIDLQLDQLTAGKVEPPETRWPANAGKSLLDPLRSVIGSRFKFERLALQYDIARGIQLAAARVLDSLGELKDVDPAILDRIRSTYEAWLRDSAQRLEEMRVTLPEMTRAIETQLARRISLERLRHHLHDAEHSGAIDQGTAHGALADVERHLKELSFAPTETTLPSPVEICRNTKLFRSLDDTAVAALQGVFKEEVLARGDTLFSEGDTGDAMYVIARGAAVVEKVIDGKTVQLEVLGGGEVVGEMALLTEAPRTATIRALTPLTLGKVSRADFLELIGSYEGVRTQIYDAFASREFDNQLRDMGRFRHLDHKARLEWFREGQTVELAPDEALSEELRGDHLFLFLFKGAVDIAGRDFTAPLLIELGQGREIKARDEVGAVLLPPRPEHLAAMSHD